MVIVLFLLFFMFRFSNVSAAEIILSDIDTAEITKVEQELTVPLELKINSSDGTVYYLRGAFFKEGTSQYCGYTWNGSEWYNGPFTSGDGWKKLLTVTIASDSAKTEIKVKVDSNDSHCREPGDYLFKVLRYTEAGNSSGDDQTPLKIRIALPSPTPTTAPSATNAPVKSQTVPAKPKITLLPTHTLFATAIIKAVSSSPKIPIASSLGFISSDSGEVSPVNEASVAGITEKSQGNIANLFIPVIFLIFLSAFLSFNKLRKQGV